MKEDRKHYIGILLGSILVVIAGILIIIYNSHLLLAIMIVAGITILIDGVYTLSNFKGWNLSSVSSNMAISKGVVQIVIGLLAILLPIFIGTKILDFFIYIIAIVLVLSSIVSFENAFAFKKNNKDLSVSPFLASGTFSILLAIILFINPTGILSTIVSVIGIFVIIAGVSLFIWSLRIRKMLKKSDTVINASYEKVDTEEKK